jgi:hypothetical protein
MLSLVAAEAENGTAETVIRWNHLEMQSGRGPAQATDTQEFTVSIVVLGGVARRKPL